MRSARSKQIVNGRLYSLNGVTVRALTQMDNGIRLVGLHKRLFGFAKDSELALITPEVVAEYLNNA